MLTKSVISGKNPLWLVTKETPCMKINLET